MTITRIVAALGIASALATQAWADLSYGTFTWDQLPGYFTPLANVAGIVALLGSVGHRRRTEPRWVAIMRVNAATYLVIVGAVYWAVLAPFTEPIFPWANAVIHGGSAVILVLDWLVVGTRRRLTSRHLWSVLVLPGMWLGYLMVRGVVDGWVPYPFLDPARGAIAVAGSLLGIAATGVIVAGILHLLGALRGRIMAPVPAPAPAQARPHEARPVTRGLGSTQRI
ncbi:Pr6Pr family membrane protein [Demequina sp. SYSU T00039]|uniref:Pr6Pr family membrane protein n=1 Tax=Demequina lignilytica TaxID=3051663 RepID=A0AAW7M804_9MICO|nr:MULTISPECIES: Pr6Pr family membrane protein [unclassified Demequina]MDN4486621.1 Pr6Pr family membrane protein [Demequina sp. SYSU T00039]MDN4489307.1 Pr6Pr family membrane protein [Demequina sp. SYSU T00068]